MGPAEKGGGMTALLQIRGLHRRFGGLQAVKNVGFDLFRHQIKAVIGPNGAGKTTLFNLIAGGLASDAGEIVFDGRPIHRWPAHRVAEAGIARTFQNIKLFGNLSVLENVQVGCHRWTRAGMLAGLFAAPHTRAEEARIRSRAYECLETMGIADLADRPAGALAFGQQRAVELARALAMNPLLLLLDEPAAGLNLHETAQLGELIRKIRDLQVTLLLVEHDMSLVMDISDEIVVLSFGEKIAEGRPVDIQRHPEVIRVYLGEDDA